MQHLVGSGTPVLYIGRTVLKGQYELPVYWQLILGQLSLTEKKIEYYDVGILLMGLFLRTSVSSDFTLRTQPLIVFLKHAKKKNMLMARTSMHFF